jgi:hypothetical protein
MDMVLIIDGRDLWRRGKTGTFFSYEGQILVDHVRVMNVTLYVVPDGLPIRGRKGSEKSSH